jgi:ABC-type maltose transport system permease subunit
MMAGAVMIILPIMIVFIALQKYYISGIMAAGLKKQRKGYRLKTD